MRFLSSIAVMSLVLGTTLPALAVDSVSAVAFRIEASNADGTNFVEIPSTDLVYNAGLQRYTWTPVLPVEIWGSDPVNPIGVLNSATLAFQFGTFKRIGLSFNLSAGDTDTVFEITTGTMSFDTLGSAFAAARATAALSVLDEDLNGIGRMEEYPAGTGDGMYQTWYNGATNFVGLIPAADISSGGSESENYPAVGFENLNVPVSSMTTSYSFTLTANDEGAGTTNFIITPEPAALGLLAAALLVLRRR